LRAQAMGATPMIHELDRAHLSRVGIKGGVWGGEGPPGKKDVGTRPPRRKGQRVDHRPPGHILTKVTKGGEERG